MGISDSVKIYEEDTRMQAMSVISNSCDIRIDENKCAGQICLSGAFVSCVALSHYFSQRSNQRKNSLCHRMPF